MDKVLLTPNEAWDERERWSKAMGQCTQDDFIPFDSWRDAAQCRKLLAWGRTECHDEGAGHLAFERFSCPKCMAQIEEALK